MVEALPAKPKAPSECLTFAVIGPQGSGKSTMLGQILKRLEPPDSNIFSFSFSQFRYDWETFKMKAREYRDDHPEFIMLADRTRNEIYRRRTEHFKHFKLEPPGSHRQYYAINTPGRPRGLKQVIVAVAQSDAVVLVIDASRAEFEANIKGTYDTDGAIKELLYIVQGMGIRQIVVAVNYKEGQDSMQFTEIKSKLKPLLLKTGFKAISTHILPLDAYAGTNLMEHHQMEIEGESFQSLLDTLGSLRIPKQPAADRPLRISIDSAYKIGGIGSVACGKIESGSLKREMKLQALGPNDLFQIGSVETPFEKLWKRNQTQEEKDREPNQIGPGQLVGINIRMVSIWGLIRMKRFVWSDPNHEPCREAEFIVAQIMLVAKGQRLRKGRRLQMHCNMQVAPCRVEAIICKLNKQTGEAIEGKVDQLVTGDAALVELVPEQTVVVETQAETPSFSRFLLRDNQVTLAIGVAKEVTKAPLPSQNQ